MNRFGTQFRLALWGESHGPQIGLTIDGVPAGMALSADDFAADLASAPLLRHRGNHPAPRKGRAANRSGHL